MRKVGTLAALGVSAIMLLLAPPAQADDTPCIGALGPGTFDNVVVPPGQTCQLVGSLVRGNVKALENSVLRSARNDIRGNLEGDKAERVLSLDDTVRENILIKEGETPAGPFQSDAEVSDSRVTFGDIQIEKMAGEVRVLQVRVFGGDVKVEDNTVTFLDLSFNTVAGNMQVFENRGPGFKRVAANNVGGNLQCWKNDPPFLSAANVVVGNAEGQCAQP